MRLLPLNDGVKYYIVHIFTGSSWMPVRTLSLVPPQDRSFEVPASLSTPLRIVVGTQYLGLWWMT
jgi:hypothetical protein